MTDNVTDSGWSEDDSRHFMDYGHYFVPERETQIDTICSVIPPAPKDSLIVDVCCGEGLLASALARRFNHCHILALDGSSTMLEATRRRLGEAGTSWTTALIDIAATGWRQFDRPVHAFVSSLAVHHLDGAGKAGLFKDLAASLSSGGVIVVCDLVEAQRHEGRALWERHWDNAVRERALRLDGNQDMLNFFREDGWNYYSDPEADPVDMPSGLYEQLTWMQEARLSNVDLHWLVAGHAIFSGRKP